jgi:GNAT superfamily N-acetyltransferase
LREITDAALPGEDLSEDELSSVAEIGAVLAVADGSGAAVVLPPGTRRAAGSDPAAAVVLLAVVPGAQGRGTGRQLLEAAAEWAFAGQGASSLWAGASDAPGPRLWPGVDVSWTRALCLFETAGYQDAGTVLDLACPATYRASPPPGVTVTRVLEDSDAAAARRVTTATTPGLAGDVARAVEHGSCLLATDRGRPVGVGCHSVNRVGWIGPVLVAGTDRRRGIGASLLSSLCTDLRAAGRPEAPISWAWPMVFYARTAGASVYRVSRRLVLAKP